MTTIVYRDGVLAADTAIFDRGCYCGQAVKIWQAPDGRLGGVAGCMGDSVLFREWFMGGAVGVEPAFKDDESEGLIINPDCRLEWIGRGGKRYPITAINESFYAVGSGFEVALGALHAGASAIDAVGIACKIDSRTRAPIIVLQVAPV